MGGDEGEGGRGIRGNKGRYLMELNMPFMNLATSLTKCCIVRKTWKSRWTRLKL